MGNAAVKNETVSITVMECISRVKKSDIRKAFNSYDFRMRADGKNLLEIICAIQSMGQENGKITITDKGLVYVEGGEDEFHTWIEVEVL